MSITTAVGIGGFLLGGLTALICLSILANIKKPPNPSNSSMSPEREEQLRIMAIDVNVNLSRSKMQCALKDLIEEIDVLREQIWSMINKEV